MDTSFKIAYCSVTSLSSMVFSLHGKKIYIQINFLWSKCSVIKEKTRDPLNNIKNEWRKKESWHDIIHSAVFEPFFCEKGDVGLNNPLNHIYIIISPASLAREQNYFSFTMFVQRKVFTASKILPSTLNKAWTSVNTAVLNTSSPLRIFALSHDR